MKPEVEIETGLLDHLKPGQEDGEGRQSKEIAQFRIDGLSLRRLAVAGSEVPTELLGHRMALPGLHSLTTGLKMLLLGQELHSYLPDRKDTLCAFVRWGGRIEPKTGHHWSLRRPAAIPLRRR